MTIGVLVKSDESGQETTPIVLRRRTRFGRTSTCDVFLHDHSVSRDHAIIERRPEGYALVDHNSRNGTRVNGVAVTRRFLHDGDHVAFGDERFVFHEIEEDTIQEPAEPQAPAAAEPTDVGPETRPIPEFDGHIPRDWRIINAWQVVQEFKMCAKSSLENVLRHIASELVGTYGVRKALLFLSSSQAGRAPKWIRAGSSGAAMGEKMPEDKVRSVADTGVPLSLCRGRFVSGVAEAELEAVCVPINVGDAPSGCLYVEADEFLPAGFSATAKSVAEAVGIGLSIKAGPMAEDSAGNVRAPCREAVPIIGRSHGLQQVARMARKAAATDSTVLLSGETGTGKEVIAEFIVAESRRRDMPFIKVHCSAVPETLLESALFGHEKGAFTGAVGQKKGYFEAADGGTIFLDEIGEWSLEMQVKLLRVLQEKEFMRVGGNKTIRVDVRVITATNRNLAQRIREGKFREDLFYRLNGRRQNAGRGMPGWLRHHGFNERRFSDSSKTRHVMLMRSGLPRFRAGQARSAHRHSTRTHRLPPPTLVPHPSYVWPQPASLRRAYRQY